MRAGIFVHGVGDQPQEEDQDAQSSAQSKRPLRSIPTRSEIPHASQSQLLESILEAVNATRANMDQRMDGFQKKLEEQGDHLVDSMEEFKLLVQTLEHKFASLQQSIHQPTTQPPPKISTVIEVPSHSPLAILFPNFTTSQPSFFIPLLNLLHSASHLPTPPIYISTPLIPQSTTPPVTSQTQPTIPTTSPPLNTIPSSTEKPVGDLNLPPFNFEDPPEDSVSFQRTLSKSHELVDDASTLVDNDKKGEKKEEEKAEGNNEDVRMDEEDVVMIDTEPIIEEPRDPVDDALAIIPYVPPRSDPVIMISREIFVESLLSTSLDIPRLPEWKPETSDT